MLRVIIASCVLALSGFVSLANAASYPDFTDLIQESSPAVVKINTVSRVQTQSGFNLEGIPPQFRDYFEQFQQPEGNSSGIGSGFIISEDGYIVTNHHVVDGATSVTVRLDDRREYAAEIVGSDVRSDVALLKIEESKLPTVEFADSNDIEVGDWVLAIGSPFDLDYSASAGIVSAIGRSLPNGSGQNYVPFIQTDVAINPGNSGGPLFNMDGQVVGINSQILSRSGGFMGLSFAVPVSVATDVIEQLQNQGTVSRGWLGVSIQEVSVDLAKSFGMSKPQGALVSQVFSGSPADEAGLRPGDVILEFDGNNIEYSHDLPHVVGLISPGSKADAKIFRERTDRTLEVTVGELTEDGSTRRTSSRLPETDSSDDSTLGLVLTSPDARTLSSMGLSGGLEVVDVAENSAAAKAGLAPGDVIVQLNFENISTQRDFDSVVEDIPNGTVVPILFYRQGNSIFRTIEVDD